MISQLENDSGNSEARVGNLRSPKQEVKNTMENGKYLGWKNTIDRFDELTESKDRTLVDKLSGIRAEEDLVKSTENVRTEKEKKAVLGNDDDNKTSMTTDGSCGQFKEVQNTKAGIPSQV